MSKTHIARLKITLDHVEPIVMRRVVVPLSIRLDRLHALVQVAMGWSDGHQWAFATRGIEWGPRKPGGDSRDGPLDASKAKLGEVLEDVGAKTLRYVYDFGDGWQHTIKVERLFAGVPGLSLPFLLEATCRCPPEDIGGPAAYMELLAALADRQHARHSEAVEHLGKDFSAIAVNVKTLERAVDEMAERWFGRAQRTRAPARAAAR